MTIVGNGVPPPALERLSSNGDPSHSDSGEPSAPLREAILYVPGLFSTDDDFETIVAKLSDAATTFGRNMSARYQYAKAAVQLKPLGNASTDAYAISEISSGTPVPVVDVFRLDYEAGVVGEYVRANVVMKALQLILTLHWLAPAILATAKKSYRKTRSQRYQLIYALGVLVAIAIYFLLTLIAILEIVIGAFIGKKPLDTSAAMTAVGTWISKACPGLAFLVGGAPSARPPWRDIPSTSIVSSAAHTASFAALWCRAVLEIAYHKLIYSPGDYVLGHATAIAVVLTALGFASPKLRSNFEATMNHMLAAIEYFRIGFARNRTTGQFYDLYDDLCKATDRYDRVNVMGYSFGALVALDALFYTRGVNQARTDRLGDLITIGAPITLAQTFWPKHFDTIYARFSPGKNHQWTNVQCALDVLASPILDLPPDPIVPSANAANVAQTKGSWVAQRPAEVARQTTDVLADSGDPNNINFSSKVNLDYSGWYPLDLSLPEFFSMAAIRAHAMYWTPRTESAYNAFDRISPDLVQVRVP